jgi:alpha-glucan,water dikinase
MDETGGEMGAKEESQEITAQGGTRLLVKKRVVDGLLEVTILRQDGQGCLLHWGLGRAPGAPWQLPPEALWPEGSRPYGRSAVQTPFGSGGRITIRLGKRPDYSVMNFVLYYPDAGRWDNNGGRNYLIALPRPEKAGPSPEEALKKELRGKEVSFEDLYDLGGEGRLAAAVYKEEGTYRLAMATDIPSAVLHWGVALRSRYEWLLPPAGMRPEGTEVLEKAAETPFAPREGLYFLSLGFRADGAPMGIKFVLRQEGRWLKDRGRDFYIPLAEKGERPPFEAGVASLAEEIVEAEMGRHSWSLMHRFDLCHDLLERARGNVEALALIFVWLRFSAIRQLDWQRQYNTKPRELSHAQDRLTLKLAGLYVEEPGSREFVRLMLTTLGRGGGQGQRIRDEILAIMHRHHIKEVAGHFMEEWHQKIHNNTTPDDIVICEAYLVFLRSDGDQEVFYSTLLAGGVSKARLEGFERPIRSQPDFLPHLKDALIRDFEQYLRVLKSVHSGTDLETALDAARYLLDGETKENLFFILAHRDDRGVPLGEFARRAVAARRSLNRLSGTERDNAKVRDSLFLDLALEDFLRVVVERSAGRIAGEELVGLICPALEHMRLSREDFELSACQREWERLGGLGDEDWALHAHAVLERAGRAINDSVDRYYGLLQGKAEYLGRAFQADAWSISLFTEEFVRGRPAFVLSLLMHGLAPVLRQRAKLGNWRVISPAVAEGRVEVVAALGDVQGRRFDTPTVVVADKVMGDEEPPEGVTAVITPGTVDLVSHIAVRARNARLLFASCYDRECIGRLKAFKGQVLHLAVSPSGDVVFEEAEGGTAIPFPRGRPLAGGEPLAIEGKKAQRPEFKAYALGAEGFREGLVGGKSLNLARLKGRLPEWVLLPASCALPFGVFEKVLSIERNRKTAELCRELIERIGDDPPEVLAEMRRTLMGLEPPEGLMAALEGVMAGAGLPAPERWEEVWEAIKGVWASKWNERAYLSRKTWGIPHGDLYMAVLVQEVVDAEYAFVIHTVNPSSGDRGELYAEVVLGLGETLVGNYPGRALSFVARKDAPEPKLLSYPGKGIGLFGGGLIFRSDSNGEDLVDYAGAGLYESIIVRPPRRAGLDYSEEPLVWDRDFRDRLLRGIAEIGIMVEKAMGSPQDIEGAYAKGRYWVLQTRPQIIR